MYSKIVKEIKRYNNIVIARHINVDPDAMASQVALKESIKLTYPKKNVYIVGASSAKFGYMGKMDKINTSSLEDALLIVVDTPDKKRIDIGDIDNFAYKIKIDHHPFMENFCDLELIDSNKSSASEMVYDLLNNTCLKINSIVAEYLFYGIIADTGRLLFNNSTPSDFAKTIETVAGLIKKYDLDSARLYANLYRRPFNELQLEGYMATNMKVTDNGVGYVKVTNEIITKYGIDSASSGDIINVFNHIDELLVWMSATEDVRNNYIRVSIRSRGPIINKVAEKYSGGGHKFASGAKVPSFEEVDMIIKDLDKLCEEYIKGCESNED